MPVAIAARGMPACSASSGSCAIVRPPRSLMRLMPIAPSPSAPERTIAAACGPCVSASVRKNRSTATRLAALGRERRRSCRWPFADGSVLARRDHVDVVRPRPRSRRAPACTGIVVARCRISGSMLSWSADEVQDDDEGHAAVGRHRLEEAPAARRCCRPSRPGRPSAASRRAALGTASSITLGELLLGVIGRGLDARLADGRRWRPARQSRRRSSEESMSADSASATRRAAGVASLTRFCARDRATRCREKSRIEVVGRAVRCALRCGTRALP